MADQERLSQWVLSNAKDLNLRVTKLDWIKEYYKGYSDIAIKIEIGSKIYQGRGSDIDSTVALMKGVTESIERFVCRENKVSSIGVAGHYDLDLAKENSLLEFIERSLISFHFDQKVGMKHISTKAIAVNTKDFGEITLKVHQYQMAAPESYCGVFTLAEGIDTDLEIGGIMGTSAARNFEEALRKSSIECFRNIAALSTHSRESMSLDHFRKIKKTSSEDSQNLLFNKQYCKGLLDIFSSSNSAGSPLNLNLQNLIFEELQYSSSILKDCPLKFVRCLDENQNPAPDTEFVG